MTRAMLVGIATFYRIPTEDHDEMIRRLELKGGEEPDATKRALLELATTQLVGASRVSDIHPVLLMRASLISGQ